MAVIERHHATGSMGLGFIQGIGLARGAMAGTVAHDHHNLVVIGADDESMRLAAQAVADMGGGLVVVAGGAVQAALPLPVGGLMSDRPIAEVREGYDALRAAAAALGSPLHDPFMAMSFMALEVIPKLKLTAEPADRWTRQQCCARSNYSSIRAAGRTRWLAARQNAKTARKYSEGNRKRDYV